MDALSIIALVGIYLWLELHPFDAPQPKTNNQDPQLN